MDELGLYLALSLEPQGRCGDLDVFKNVKAVDRLVDQLEVEKLGRKVRWSLDVDPVEMY